MSFEYFDVEQEFNSFQIIWKDKFMQTFREPLNPYSMTMRQGLENLEDKLLRKEQVFFGVDETAQFECMFNDCRPPLSSDMDTNILLHDMYKHLPSYPQVEVLWNLFYNTIVQYKHTINPEIEKREIQKNSKLTNMKSISNERAEFNPLLFECDVHKIKIIEDLFFSKYFTNKNKMKALLHEIIKNGYLCDLIYEQEITSKKARTKMHEKIKKESNLIRIIRKN
ncbi:hypothetical protein RFI_30492 [Reticulomyxa filosa]|uniref:Uncharacterized protein n=1 Tax=Reticulomyxa filosa TaxID=46433 RepID=X6LYC8_RETFI|nr:hypothetical protein RFI_30492 [Reticulomyxa filosa]|eukprot:ETO06898.1 hypothetical protein RFI_30492 [Reticulomyxa filosa]